MNLKNIIKVSWLPLFLIFLSSCQPAILQSQSPNDAHGFHSNGADIEVKSSYPSGRNINPQGASINDTIISNNGLRQEIEIKLIFKDSPLFTPERKKRISAEINAFKSYLAGFGFEIPKESPPFGVSETPPPSSPSGIPDGRTYGHISIGPPCGNAMKSSRSDGESFLEDITILDKDVDNLAMWRRAYAEHVFWRIFRCANLENEVWKGVISVFVNYLAGSYANQRPQNIEGERDLIINTLWDIRNTCGQDFTDRSLFQASKIKTQRGIGFDKYFLECFSRGSAIVDNEFHNVPKINEILKKNNLPWLFIPFSPGGLWPTNDIKKYNEAYGGRNLPQ